MFIQPDLTILCFCLNTGLVFNGGAQSVFSIYNSHSFVLLDTPDERTDEQTLDQSPAIGNPSSRPSSRYVGNLSIDVK